MDFSSNSDVALILPIPVSRHDGGSVQFVDLSTHPEFFDKLDSVFPPEYTGMKGSRSMSFSLEKTLEVHKVGSFEASFVPTAADFDRLDPRFSIPTAVWSGTEQEGYGFVVAKLSAFAKSIHPLAFTFRRDASLSDGLFFPTFHIHDGVAHEREMFDHALYFQLPASIRFSTTSSEKFDGAIAPGGLPLVGPGLLIRKQLSGVRDNQDTFYSWS